MDEKVGERGFAIGTDFTHLCPREKARETKRVVTEWNLGLKREFTRVATDCANIGLLSEG